MADQTRKGIEERASLFERRNQGAEENVRKVQASVAKTHFSQLLDDVERGATIVILRHGRPIARLTPEGEERRRQVAEAIDNITRLGKQIRERNGPISIEEIISSIHEGHKY